MKVLRIVVCRIQCNVIVNLNNKVYMSGYYIQFDCEAYRLAGWGDVVVHNGWKYASNLGR